MCQDIDAEYEYIRQLANSARLACPYTRSDCLRAVCLVVVLVGYHPGISYGDEKPKVAAAARAGRS